MVGTSPAASTSPASFEPPLPTQPATPPVYARNMPQQSPHVQPCNMTQPVVGTSQTMSANHPFADVRPAQMFSPFSPQQQTTPQQPHQPQPQPPPSSDSEFRSPAEPQPRPQQTPQVPSRPISPPPQDATPSPDFSSETHWPCISATQTLSKCEDRCEGFRGALGSTFPFVVHSREESEVVKAVNKYAAGYFEVAKTSGKTGDNSFQISCCKYRPGTLSGKGKGTHCKWTVSFAKCQEGYALTSTSGPAGNRISMKGVDYSDHTYPSMPGVQSYHNHPMHASAAEARASVAGMGGVRVPDELEDLAGLLGRTGSVLPPLMNTILRQAAAEAHIEPTWDLKHLRYKYKPDSEKIAMDFTGMCDELEDRKSNTGLLHFYGHKEDGSNEFAMLFVELAGGKEEWAKGEDKNTVLFDPTHGTNVYDWKLCLFTVIGGTGKTVIVALAVLSSESKAQFQWAFTCFQRVFITPPIAVFTDRDPNLLTVLAAFMVPGAVWDGATHFYCIWHLSKNVHEHLRRLFLGDKNNKAWKKVHDFFWEIVKDTDISAKASFAARWNSLVELVQTTATCRDESQLHEQLEWLRKLGQNPEHFAACYVWGTCTSGIKSTQRIEAMQRVSKDYIGCNRRTTLLDLYHKFVNYNVEARDRQLVDEVRKRFRNLFKSLSMPLLMKHVQSQVTPFAYELVAAQFSLSLSYKSKVVSTMEEEEEITYEVTPDSLSDQRRHTDDQGDVNTSEFWEDFGLEESPKGRLVRLTVKGDSLEHASCSCQFGTSWGVTLCRHILHVCTVQQLRTCNVPQLFILKWQEITPEKIYALTSGLVAAQTAASRARLPVSSDLGDSAICTSQERKQRLLPLTNRLMEIGMSGERGNNLVFDALTAALHKIEGLVLEPSKSKAKTAQRPKPQANNPPTAQGVTAGSAATQAAPSAPTSACTGQLLEPLVVQSALSPVAHKKLAKELGIDWAIGGLAALEPSTMGLLPHPEPMAEKMRSMEEVLEYQGCLGFFMKNQHVAYHYEKYGWCVGEVLKPLSGQDTGVVPAKHLADLEQGGTRRDGIYPPNFRVEFGPDDVQDLFLYRCNCLNLFPVQDPPVTSWVLLRKKDISDCFNAPRPFAPTAVPKGRAKVQRKKPVNGAPDGANSKANGKRRKK